MSLIKKNQIEDYNTWDVTEVTDKNYVTDAEKTVINNTTWSNTGDNSANTNTWLVHTTGDEWIAWIKTFTSSPIAPIPNTSLQVANKQYVDDSAWGGVSEFFSVIRTVDSWTGAWVDTLLVWGTILVNDNWNFSLANEEYTAPSDWDYIFDLSLYTENNEISTILWLYNGSNVLYSGQSTTSGTSQWQTHRVFTKMTLTAWDKVRWRVTFSGANVISSNSSFSWYKIS